MIEIKDIKKSFDGKTIIEGISTRFEKGRVNLIIGQSGSGKSVLTKCIVGLLEPDTGEVLYDGKNFLAMKKKEKKKTRQEIGMLFQGSALFDSLNVEENIAFPLKMFTDSTNNDIRNRVNMCLDVVHLDKTNKLYPAELSGGMQKRVAIARAIAMNPKYLFCDEPNSGLDPKTAIVIDNLIREITYEYGITTIVITHDMNSVMEIGDHINFIYEGRLAWRGNKQEIITTDNREVSDFVYASEFMKKLQSKLREG